MSGREAINLLGAQNYFSKFVRVDKYLPSKSGADVPSMGVGLNLQPRTIGGTGPINAFTGLFLGPGPDNGAVGSVSWGTDYR